MKKLSEYKNEDALELLADIIDPLAEILGDPEVAEQMKRREAIAKAVAIAIKKHKTAIFNLLARLEGVPADEYQCGVFTLPAKLIEIFSDKEFADFFALQGQRMGVTSSGPVTEITQETETE